MLDNKEQDKEFDEFPQGAIPPEPSTNSEAVRIVSEAASTNPAFRAFLLEWFPTSRGRSGRQKVPKGNTRPVGSDVAVSEDQVRDHMSSNIALCASQRAEIATKLQIVRYRQLLADCAKNNAGYRRNRANKLCDELRNLVVPEVVPLNLGEDMFNAAHYDLQTGTTVDLDRITRHRTSVKTSMHEMVKREIATLKNEFSNLSTTDGTHELDEIVFSMKAEIVKNIDEIQENKTQIAELMYLMQDSTKEQKAYARASVQLKLLELLDDIVPGIEETVSRTNAVPGIDKESSKDDMDASLKKVLTSLTRFSNATNRASSLVPSLDYQSLEDRLRNLHFDSKVGTTEWASSHDTSILMLETGTPTQTIVDSFKAISDLENEIEAGLYKRQAAEFHTIHTRSADLLKDAFKKCCLESPLLAQHDLHGIDDLPRLAQIWSEACQERSRESSVRLDTQMTSILDRFKKTQESLARSTKLKSDLDAYIRD